MSLTELKINMLIWFQEPLADQPVTNVERILWIDPSRIHLITIEIFGKHSLPVLRTYNEIVTGLDSNEAQVLQNDPYATAYPPEPEIKESERRRRDAAWARIEPLIAGGVEILINPKMRGALIARQVERRLGTKTTIYKDFRWYLQRGMVKNALLRDYRKCGAPGKRRIAKSQDGPKLGRRSASEKANGKPVGIRITEDIESKFKKGIKRFYETTNQYSLVDAYDLTISEYFWVDLDFVHGQLVRIPPHKDQRPTFEQFRYWYESVYMDEKRKNITRHGEGTYNLTGRELLGDSRQMAFGPGSMFQIDPTLGDIYLLSSFDPNRIIGRPVAYSCVDVYSGALPGFCVTLEGPSWLSAMLALDIVAMDKVAFCAEFGITIHEEDWPMHHLPGAILADRGEFEGYDADTLPNSLGITIHNAAPYRPDWKGIVERQIGVAKEKVIKFLPGFVRPKRGRGDPDYRLDAALTLNDLRKILIFYALEYNMNHYMKGYKKDEYMIPDHVEPYPLEIWNWGIRNGFSHLQWKPQEVIRLNLLPRKTARVTARGIHFERDLYYTCDLAIRENWFVRARLRGSWPVEVCFDPRTTDFIYIPLEGGVSLESCRLTDASRHLKGRGWYDVMDYFALEQQAREASRTRTQKSATALHTLRENVEAEAIERRDSGRAAQGHKSKHALTKGIRENRALEKQVERDRDTWLLGVSNQDSTTAAGPDITPQHSSNGGYVPPSPKAARIRQHRDHEWQKRTKK